MISRIKVMGWMGMFIFGLFACSTTQGQSNYENYESRYSQFFEKGMIQLHDVEIPIEVARTSKNRPLGLMFRDEIPEMFGMLFIFDYPEELSFWMRNTRIPLDIGYFDEQRKLIEIHQMMPMDERSIRSSQPAVYALEVNQGWFERHNIEPGVVFEWIEMP